MNRSPAFTSHYLVEDSVSATRKLIVTAGMFALAIILALVGTGTSYALWNGTSVVDASTVTSGSTGLTVNGVTSYSIPGMDTIKIGPGQSVVAPLTLVNTGTIPLSTTISGTTVTSQTNALADELTITVTASATCTTGLVGGTTARMAEFATSATPVVMEAGSTLQLCLVVTMDADAPVSVQGGTATFTMYFDAAQVR